MTIKSISTCCATLALAFFSLQTSLQAQLTSKGCLFSPAFVGSINDVYAKSRRDYYLDMILESPNERYVLKFTTNGMVLMDRTSNTTLWSVIINGNLSGGGLEMQNDGNLVFYSANRTPLWSTDSWNHPESNDGDEKYVFLQDDGNFVVYDSDAFSAADPMWATGTCGGVANGCGTPGAR